MHELVDFFADPHLPLGVRIDVAGPRVHLTLSCTNNRQALCVLLSTSYPLHFCVHVLPLAVTLRVGLATGRRRDLQLQLQPGWHIGTGSLLPALTTATLALSDSPMR